MNVAHAAEQLIQAILDRIVMSTAHVFCRECDDEDARLRLGPASSRYLCTLISHCASQTLRVRLEQFSAGPRANVELLVMTDCKAVTVRMSL